ncbi:MAG: HD-GYP domain-containing protein [Gemmatimonadaceae bacterium]
MKPLILASPGRAIPALDSLTVGGAIEVRRISHLPDPAAMESERPTIVLLDHTLLHASHGDRVLYAELASQAALVAIGESGAAEPADYFPAEFLSGYFTPDTPVAVARLTLQAALRHAAALVAAQRATRLGGRSASDVTELSRIAVALSTERDLLTLLELILSQARRLSSADAGSLYLVERTERGPSTLRFKLSQNHTLPSLPFTEAVIPLDHTSLAGYTATTGEPLIIPDVYFLPEDVPYRQNRSFDDKFQYRTKSMLVIPMSTHRDEVIGVLQLINRKRSADARLFSAETVESEVLPFDERSVDLVSALASQAAVAIENGRLYEDIERLFEGFVTAAVTAIESRDPTTSGHSSRVATFTCGLAEAVDRVDAGPYRAVRFSREQMKEIRYAGLLHDFGKVGVREQVLVKQKKLYPGDLALVKHRFQFLLQRADLQYERERAEYLFAHGKDRYQEMIQRLEGARRADREDLLRFLDSIVRANEPTILPEGTFEELEEINERTFVDFDGVEKPLLSDEELRYLMINKGNLDERERREIESHVSHTFRFLDQIPWTRELKGIPEIAHGHHEKLNGRGYPRRMSGDAIPVQTRMMTISDIYDALTATDRPYKRAVTADRAIEILKGEAQEGALDEALLDAFIGAKVFELARPEAHTRRTGRNTPL